MQIKNNGQTPQTIMVRNQSYTIAANATLVLPDRDLVAARRAVRTFPSLQITHANDMASALSNISATVNPTPNDDLDLGYSVGSKWINTTTQDEYTCFSAANGTAVWKKTGREVIGGGGGSGSGLVTGSELPTAGSEYRGTMFLLLGGSQTPDILYICTKDYQDNYNWNEIVLIG